MASSASKRAQSRSGTVGGVPIIVLVFAAIGMVVAIGVGIALAGGDDGGSADPGAPVFAPVEVAGTPLPGYPDRGDDPAVGEQVPALSGFGFDNEPVTIGRSGEATVVAFLAHWCSHCQAEVPRLVEAADAGVLDGIRLVGVATATDSRAPNFPPSDWLERENWPGDVLVDSEAATAAAAYGIGGFPFIVWFDADGTVLARTSGEIGSDVIADLAGLLAAT